MLSGSVSAPGYGRVRGTRSLAERSNSRGCKGRGAQNVGGTDVEDNKVSIVVTGADVEGILESGGGS